MAINALHLGEMFGSYIAGGSLPVGSRVKRATDTVTVVVAAAADNDCGVLVSEKDAVTGDHVKVLHAGAPGTFFIRASGSIPFLGIAKKAASGKVGMDGAGVDVVQALTAAAADGDIIVAQYVK